MTHSIIVSFKINLTVHHNQLYTIKPREDRNSNETHRHRQMAKYYYDFAYQFDYFTLAVPFCFAIIVFYITYLLLFNSVSHRIRAKKLVSR